MRFAAGLTAILAVAVALRAHDLGRDSLWYDEVAQLNAAAPETLGGVLRVVRQHPQSIPLDYAVTHWVARFGRDEATLRTPAMVWGSLAVVFWALIARRVLGPAAGLLAAWMLALSAIHVEFSQELRFYAALLCFHGASTWLALRALEGGGARRWVVFVAVTWVGALAHVFVMLAAVGAVALWLADLPRRRVALGGWRRARATGVPLAVSLAVLAAAYLPVYLHFTSGETWHFDLLAYHDSLGQVLAEGLGFTFALPGERAGTWGAWGVASAGLAAVGAIGLVRHRPGSPWLGGLVAGAALQIVVILAGVWGKGFFFLPRQICHLAPAAMVLAAHGAACLARRMPWPPRRTLLVTAAALLLAAMPRLGDSYDALKSDGRELTAGLLATADGVSAVYVIPAREADVVRFYLERTGDPYGLAPRLRDMRWESLAVLPADAGSLLIAPVDEIAAHRALLDRLGFHVVWSPDGRRGRIRALLRRG